MKLEWRHDEQRNIRYLVSTDGDYLARIDFIAWGYRLCVEEVDGTYWVPQGEYHTLAEAKTVAEVIARLR